MLDDHLVGPIAVGCVGLDEVAGSVVLGLDGGGGGLAEADLAEAATVVEWVDGLVEAATQAVAATVEEWWLHWAWAAERLACPATKAGRVKAAWPVPRCSHLVTVRRASQHASHANLEQLVGSVAVADVCIHTCQRS